ncbi:MAG: methyltransferase domain-containing protein [Deltaproteobacteria bacterium]|nr:methyltransferase domain-containing protein [Deltaproteobacteria bacterium]
MGGHPYKGKAERLHAPERLARLEVDRVVSLAREGLTLGSVLDIGTGTGIFAEAFSLLGLKVSGIDSNAGLLEVARARLPGLEFVEGVYVRPDR